MMIIDENLKSLSKANGVCDREELIEDYCIQIRLSNSIYYRPKNSGVKIVYGSSSDALDDGYEMVDPQITPVILEPMGRILACSQEKYSIPRNVFGLVQTKGSLARLFVQVTCCDGQIEPGFVGKITLEIVNLSPFTIEIPILSKVAQLYLFQCSMNTSKPYTGKYANHTFPSLPNFEDF